jgi:Zn-dependent membrane protease YugP
MRRDPGLRAPERNETMITNRKLRRAVAVVLVFLGGLLMLLAPPVWIGAIPLALGIVLELVGITIEHGSRA